MMIKKAALPILVILCALFLTACDEGHPGVTREPSDATVIETTAERAAYYEGYFESDDFGYLSNWVSYSLEDEHGKTEIFTVFSEEGTETILLLDDERYLMQSRNGMEIICTSMSRDEVYRHRADNASALKQMEVLSAETIRKFISAPQYVGTVPGEYGEADVVQVTVNGTLTAHAQITVDSHKLAALEFENGEVLRSGETSEFENEAVYADREEVSGEKYESVRGIFEKTLRECMDKFANLKSIEEQLMNTTERELNYVTFGSGQKQFVILPGLSLKPVTGSGDAIAAAYASFTEEYTVWLFDYCDETPEDFGIREIAGDVAAMMTKLGIKDAYVFGASMGGMVGTYLAVDHPELVKELVVGSSTSSFTEEARKNIESWKAAAESGRAEELATKFIEAVYSENTLNAYRDVLMASNSDVTEAELKRVSGHINAILKYDASEDVKKITCPVLAIGSEGDRVFGPDGARIYAEKTGGELYEYEASYGHAVYDEAPDYKERLLAFFGKE